MQASRPTELKNPSQEHSGAVSPPTASAPAQGEEKEAIQTSSRTDGPYTSKPPLGTEPPGPSSASSGPSQASSSRPRLSAGPEAREKLKFILGASEDNSSDDEPLVMLPPPTKASSSKVSQAPPSSVSSEPPSQCLPELATAPSSSSMR